MKRLIKNDGKTIDFEVSVLVNHNIFPVKDVLGKNFSLKFKDRDVTFSIAQHKVPFQHTPRFAQQSASFGFSLNLIEFIFSFPMDYAFFIKKLSRYGSRLNEETLAEHPHWESIAISTVLRHLSIEIINKFIDSYRILTASVSIPPLTENSILHISYQTVSESAVSVIEDTKIGAKKIDDEHTNKLIPLLENFMAIPDYQMGFVVTIFNALRLLEAGYYGQTVSTVIDGFHSYLDYLIDRYLSNRSLKERIRDFPWNYGSVDKTTWIFEMISTKTLEQFLHDLNKGDFFNKYSDCRTKRNKIAHPDQSSEIEISYMDAKDACKTVLNIVWTLRKEIEQDERYDDILFALEMYIHKLTEHT